MTPGTALGVGALRQAVGLVSDVTVRGIGKYGERVIFPDQRRTVLARFRTWRSALRANRATTAQGVEQHQRMVQALRSASSEASGESTTD